MGIEEEQLVRLVASLDPAVGDRPPQVGTERYEAIWNAAVAGRHDVRIVARPAGRRLAATAMGNRTRSTTDHHRC